MKRIDFKALLIACGACIAALFVCGIVVVLERYCPTVVNMVGLFGFGVLGTFFYAIHEEDDDDNE
jgi:CHASE2 domain-containing sensor protein